MFYFVLNKTSPATHKRAIENRSNKRTSCHRVKK